MSSINSTFQQAMTSSYLSGDLSTDTNIKLALQYENFKNISTDLRQSLIKDKDWQNLSTHHIDTAKQEHHNFSNCANSRPLISRTPCIDPDGKTVKRIIPEGILATMQGMDTEAFKKLGDRLHKQSPETVLKRKTLLFLALREALPEFLSLFSWQESCWVSESYSTETLSLNQLVNKLGLYAYGKRKEGERYYIFTLQKIALYKPDWLDACLAFFFAENPDNVNFGMTRCLSSGKKGHKEWLAQKSQIAKKDFFKKEVLVDVEVHALDKDEEFSILKDEFKSYTADRIKSEREKQNVQ